MLLLLLACDGAPKPDDTGADTSDTGDTGADTGDTGADPADTGDTGVPPSPILMLAGGGSEGDNGDATAWSAVLYGGMLANGDVTGDGAIHVLVLSTAEETEWVPDYFVELGATSAENVQIATRDRAEGEAVRERFANADAVFLKGGDQGEYYDLWNDTLVEEGILGVMTRGGAVGGTSAGAMSQAEYALAGGNDYVTYDVLLDSHTPYLDDVSDGGSGIHPDFLALLPGTLVDTHFAVRGRLGRLAGAMAKAIDEGAPPSLLGIGLDEQTGLLVQDGVARVVGVGSVVFLRRGDEDASRVPGAPLVWAGLQVDRLTDGWVYDLATHTPDPGSSGAEEAPPAPRPLPQKTVDWYADGDKPGHEDRFGVVVERYPDPYAVRSGTDDPVLSETIGMMDAFSSDRRGAADEAMWRALADQEAITGFWVGEGGWLDRYGDDPSVVYLRGLGREPMSTMVLTVDGMTWRSSSPLPSPADAGDGALRAAGVVGARLDILYSDGADGRAWSLDDRRPAPR